MEGDSDDEAPVVGKLDSGAGAPATDDASDDEGEVSPGPAPTEKPRPGDGPADQGAGGAASAPETPGVFKPLIPVGDASVPSPKPGPDVNAPDDAGGPKPVTTGDDGPGPDPEVSTVTGKVIDFWRHPVAGVPIAIGDTTTTTASDGSFTIDDVGAEYDVQLLVRWASPPIGVYGWRFEGLTRRDPTLQVYRALDVRGATVVTTPKGAQGSNATPLAFAFGGVDGATSLRVSGAAEVSTWWFGPTTTTVTAHALSWQASDDLPVSYSGYDSKLVALVDGEKSDVNLDLSATDSIATGSIGGTVSSSVSMYRRNRVHLRFTDGAAIELVDEGTDVGTFTYAVPGLTGTTVVMSASAGLDSRFDGYAVAHADGVAAGTLDIALTVPELPQLKEPVRGATDVDEHVAFSWEADSSGVVCFVKDEELEQGFFVVTAKQELTLPSFSSLGLDLRKGAPHLWAVEVHGEYASVDEMADPDGFLDSFSNTYDRPMGPQRGSGSFAASMGFGFTTAP